MSDDFYDYIKEESKLARAGRKIATYVLSGVNFGVKNQFTEEIKSPVENWILISGVVTNYEKNEIGDGLSGGKTSSRYFIVSYDYDDIQGYEHITKIQFSGTKFTVQDRSIDYFGQNINHIDFKVTETK